MIGPTTSPQELANLLGTSYPKLNYALYARNISLSYTSFNIRKKDGGQRTIKAPSEALKNLQRRLHRLLESLYKPHPAASAFIESRGIIYNAKKHVRKAAVLNIDLQDFYGQIHFGRVKGLFVAKPYSLRQDTAQLIAKICCVDQVLPQGAPTSPLISNMICRRLDRELSHLAKTNRAFYSRYADDITFSFHKLEKNQIVDDSGAHVMPGSLLIKAISSNGFAVNPNKTRYQRYNQRQTVTGLKVNQLLNLDRRYIRTTRAMIHALANGETQVNLRYSKTNRKNFNGSLAALVAGRLNFIGMVKGTDSEVFRTLATKFNSLDLNRKVRLSAKRKPSSRAAFSLFTPANRDRLNQCVWVVSFEDVHGRTLDQSLQQASAFMIEGQRLFTASHAFTAAGDPDYCFVYRINETHKKYRAEIANRDKLSDILELRIVLNEAETFNYLKVSENLHILPGYEVALVGFPQLQPGHKSVSITPCRIINTFVRSTFEHQEVDKQIAGGSSGGPVVDGHLEVVGMIVTGTKATLNEEEVVSTQEEETQKRTSMIGSFLSWLGKIFSRDRKDAPEKVVKRDIVLEGSNAFLSSKHFPEP